MRTRLHIQFPANREKYRDFSILRLFSGSELPVSPMISQTWSQTPYLSKQGISEKEQAISSVDQGFFGTQISSV